MNWVHTLAGMATLASLAALAEDRPRVLVQEALLRPHSTSKPLSVRKPIEYRSVSKLAAAVRPAKGDTVVGITFWRLRPARPNDDPDARLLLLDDTGTEVEQVSERIEAGSPVRPGERLRLSIEVPRKGFLYVFDREQFRDGSTGPAHLIYPNFQTPPGDNAVAAGRMIEIPDRRDRINSFKLVKSRPDHSGEVLVVMVTPTALDSLRTESRTPPVIEESVMSDWERKYSLQVQQVELEGGAGQPITAAEKKSGGDRSKLLTENDPYPQTMYLVKAKPGAPILIKLPIRIGTS